MWGDDESSVSEPVDELEDPPPNNFLLSAMRGTQSARFAVLACEDGWYTHFLDGDAALRSYHRYMSYEALGQLHLWWNAEYDRHTVEYLPDDVHASLHKIAQWQWPRAK